MLPVGIISGLVFIESDFTDESEGGVQKDKPEGINDSNLQTEYYNTAESYKSRACRILCAHFSSCCRKPWFGSARGCARFTAAMASSLLNLGSLATRNAAQIVAERLFPAVQCT